LCQLLLLHARHQVPKRLGAVSCQLYGRDQGIAAGLATRAWTTLLQHAKRAGIITYGQGPPANSLAVVLRQQLMESGLLKCLPGQLTRLAQQLKEADPDWVVADPSAGVVYNSIAIARDAGVLGHALELLYGDSSNTTEEFSATVGAPCIMPAAQLSVAAAQHLSSCCGTFSSSDDCWPGHTHVMLSTCCKAMAVLSTAMAVSVLENSSSSSSQHQTLAAQLMHNSTFAECVAIYLCNVAIMQLIEDSESSGSSSSSSGGTGSGGSGNSGSGGSGNSGSGGGSSSSSSSSSGAGCGGKLGTDIFGTTPALRLQAWQLARRLTPKVPPHCNTLLQLCGCSSLGMLWMAAFQQRGLLMEHFERVGDAHYACVVPSQGRIGKEFLASLSKSGQDILELPRRAEKQFALHSYMAAVLLQVAADHPTSSEDYPRVSFVAGKSSSKALTHCCSIRHSLRTLLKMGDSQPERQPGLLEGIPDEVVTYHKQEVPKILAELLRLYRKRLADSAAANSSSSSSGVGGYNEEYVSELDAGVDLAGVMALQFMMNLVDLLRPSTPAAATVASQLWKLLEDLTRAVTAADQAGCANDAHQRTLFAVAQMILGGTPSSPPNIWRSLLHKQPAGSPEQLQLLGLLCSLLKVCTGAPTLQQLFEPHGLLAVSADSCSTLRQKLCRGVCHVALQVLEVFTPSGRQASRASPMGQAAAEATAEAEGDEQVDGMLPWLPLLGRCCLLWAAELKHHHSLGFGPKAAAGAAAAAHKKECTSLVTRIQSNVSGVVSVSRAWLTDVNVSPAMAMRGYDTEPIRAALLGLERSMDAAHSSAERRPGVAADAAAELAVQLKAAGQALSSLAVTHYCNNPKCSNVGCPSESELLLANKAKCAGCRIAMYCGRACQKQHWRQHKATCQALAAAAAAATGTGGGAAGAAAAAKPVAGSS